MTNKRNTPPAETGRSKTISDGMEILKEVFREPIAPVSPEPPLNVRLKGDKDKERFCIHGVELIKWCKICDGAGTVGVTPEPTELRESLRPAAKEYLREWSDNYRRHGELALLHWDGGNIEYHLANFAARAAQSLPSPTSQQWEVYTTQEAGHSVVTCHTRVVGGVLCRWWGDGPEPEGVKLIDEASSPTQPVGSVKKERR